MAAAAVAAAPEAPSQEVRCSRHATSARLVPLPTLRPSLSPHLLACLRACRRARWSPLPATACRRSRWSPPPATAPLRMLRMLRAGCWLWPWPRSPGRRKGRTSSSSTLHRWSIGHATWCAAEGSPGGAHCAPHPLRCRAASQPASQLARTECAWQPASRRGSRRRASMPGCLLQPLRRLPRPIHSRFW